MIRYLFILILSFTLWGGETTIVLKNGQQYLVKTTFGKPDHQSNEYFSIASIRPSYDQFEGWRNIHFFWAITLGMNKEFNGTLIIDSPLLPGKSWPILLISGPAHNFIKIHRFEIMESETTPNLWDWVNEPGESWIPFHFKVKIDTPGKQIDFIEWVKISEKEKEQTRLDFKKIKSFYNKHEVIEITSITNDKHRIQVTKSGPLRFENNFLQINSLLPGIINNTLSDNNRPLAFSISGKYRGNTGTILTISAPWSSNNFSYKVKIKNSGDFQIPFASSHMNPELWRWLESTNEFWLPFRLQVENESTGQSFDFIEWFQVTNDIRLELVKLRKP